MDCFLWGGPRKNYTIYMLDFWFLWVDFYSEFLCPFFGLPFWLLVWFLVLAFVVPSIFTFLQLVPLSAWFPLSRVWGGVVGMDRYVGT